MKKYFDKIETNHNVMLGKPVLIGTRLSVELILRKLSQGATIEDLKKMYPDFTLEQYEAVMEYAADILANEEILAI